MVEVPSLVVGPDEGVVGWVERRGRAGEEVLDVRALVAPVVRLGLVGRVGRRRGRGRGRGRAKAECLKKGVLDLLEGFLALGALADGWGRRRRGRRSVRHGVHFGRRLLEDSLQHLG